MKREYSDRYLATWSRAKRNLVFDPHDYVSQNHCRDCFHTYIKRWRQSRDMKTELPEHDFVSHWHCRACRSKGGYINRRLHKELKDYLAGACRVRCDEDGNRLRDEKGRFKSRVVILR
jgi:hypothetical protein